MALYFVAHSRIVLEEDSSFSIMLLQSAVAIRPKDTEIHVRNDKLEK